MKLLEFFGIIRENASNGTGKFVGARLTRDSERDIMRWMRDNGLRKKEPRARMHITVIGDKEYDFPWNPATFSPPLEIDSSSYKIQKFDHGSIVLSFSVPELEKRHEWAVEQHAIQWDYPTYQPHITLSIDPTSLNDIDRLLLPTFPMYVSHEYEQSWSFDESDSSTNRRRNTRLAEDFLAERNLMNAPLAKAWGKNAADVLVGYGARIELPDEMRETLEQWAVRAISRYFVNDMPASRILSFAPGDDQGTWRPPEDTGLQPREGIEGHGEIITPQDEAYGITAGHQGLRSITVPPWVPASLERGDELYFLDKRGVQGLVNSSMFGAVRDWFRHLVRQHPEKVKTGALNRLSWEEAVESAVAWHQSMRAAETSDEEENPNHRAMYIDYDNGTAWWKLIGETCLTREGDLMGHCVADYVDDVESGHSVILSLRDDKNNPHVTVELNDIAYTTDAPKAGYTINQVKGKGNKPPVDKYWKYVDELIKKLDADGLELSTSREGHEDLDGCNILELGPLFVRTEPEPFGDASCIVSVIQYPPDQEWSMYDHEEMQLWEAIHHMKERDMLPQRQRTAAGAESYIKWLLLRDGEFEVETTAEMDPAFFHDNPDYTGLGDESVRTMREVPTSINIKVSDIKYEILSGDPKEFQYDIKHEMAIAESERSSLGVEI